MVTDTSEKNLETILVSYLCDAQGYEEGTSEDYNKNYALDTERVKRFILSTQKRKLRILPVLRAKYQNASFLPS